ncbi:hypothetical protein GCM10027271_52710 [Saccharopolyspora gloriosae]
MASKGSDRADDEAGSRTGSTATETGPEDDASIRLDENGADDEDARANHTRSPVCGG